MSATTDQRKGGRGAPALISTRAVFIALIAAAIGICTGVGVFALASSAGGLIVAVAAGIGAGSTTALSAAEALNKLIDPDR